jgi:hypothetical protein
MTACLKVFGEQPHRDIPTLAALHTGTCREPKQFITNHAQPTIRPLPSGWVSDLAGTGQLYMILATGNAALDGNGVRVFSSNGDGTFKFYHVWRPARIRRI